MKRLINTLPALLILPVLLSACSTTKKVEEAEAIFIPPVVQTCYPVASLKKNVTPAVTKSGFSIVSIESPEEYVYDERTGKTTIIKHPPIQRKQPWTRIVEPEKIYYTTDQGTIITDICELNDAEETAEEITEPMGG